MRLAPKAGLGRSRLDRFVAPAIMLMSMLVNKGLEAAIHHIHKQKTITANVANSFEFDSSFSQN